MGGSLKRSLGMAHCSLCKAQHLITIGITAARPAKIVKKPLPGGGRGESEITSRSLNAKLDTSQIPSSAGEVK